MNKIVIIRDLWKHYQSGNEQLQILKGLNLEITKGEFVSIVGASGSGKTTLLNLISALDTFDSGTIIVDGIKINTLTEKEFPEYRSKKIGFIFQHHNLLTEFTAIENILIPLLIQRVDRKIAYKKSLELIERIGLKERSHHKPGELSGGEKQRIAVARALITQPALIVADEPTGNLDKRNAEHLWDLFKSLQKERQQTVILVTHDYDIAKKADKIYQLKDGVLTKIEI